MKISILAVLALAAAFATAPVTKAQDADATALPSVPTTKVLAIGTASAALTAEQRKTIMPNEVRDTVRLFLAGKIDQWWSRQDGNGVVFLMNVSTVEEAHALLEKLPLGQAKLIDFTLIPVGPLKPLSILLGDTPAPQR
jgi:hypothetical protein